MVLTREQIKNAAIELDPKEREALAEELLLGIASDESEQIDVAWLEEIQRREAEYEAGKMPAIPLDEAVDAIVRKARRVAR